MLSQLVIRRTVPLNLHAAIGKGDKVFRRRANRQWRAGMLRGAIGGALRGGGVGPKRHSKRERRAHRDPSF